MSKADNGMTNAAGIAYGELIRRQRKAKKMNQEELGALARVGKNAVGAWEAGRSRPDVGSVPVICEALDLSLEEFFGMPEGRLEHADEKAGISTEERTTLISRYGELNAYNRQVILRQMSQKQWHLSQKGPFLRLLCRFLDHQAHSREVFDTKRIVYLVGNRYISTTIKILI